MAITQRIDYNAPRNELNIATATQRGIYIHKALQHAAMDNWNLPDWLPQQSELYISSYRATTCLKSVNAKPLATERFVVLHDYQGRQIDRGKIDLLAEINGEIILIDYKTEAKQMLKTAVDKQKEDWSYQLSAYALAASREVDIDRLLVLHLPRQAPAEIIELPRLSSEQVLSKYELRKNT